MTDSPGFGVPADGARDGAGASSRAFAEGFFSKGVTLPPLYGPIRRGTRVRTWFSGTDAFDVTLDTAGTGLSVSVWTDERGIESLIGDLTDVLVRARAAREQAS
jgi:hypothetical protein